jgi:Tfp pilus assembly protein PilO
MTSGPPGVADPEPSAALGAYRVRARFEGDFAGIAGFLGGLGRLERAVAVHDLEIKPAKGTVHVDLELDVYVASTTES